MTDVKLFKTYGESQILEILKKALMDGRNFGLDKSFIINEITIKNNALLISYESEIDNKFVIYNDFALIIGFVYSFLVGEFEENSIYNIGVRTTFPNNSELYILSPIESAKAISTGNTIYWLKNSIVNENLIYPTASYLLVEGESEIEAFPILFKALNVDIEQYKITIIPYSKHNIRSMLTVLNVQKEPFLLVCDKDKGKEVIDLKREGLLDNNFHILENGEFEDYIEPQSLIEILNNFTPNLDLTPEYIEKNRTKGIGTSKIVAKYYHQESPANQCPAKPDVAIKIAEFWCNNNKIPNEFKDIMVKTINLTGNQKEHNKAFHHRSTTFRWTR